MRLESPSRRGSLTEQKRNLVDRDASELLNIHISSIICTKIPLIFPVLRRRRVLSSIHRKSDLPAEERRITAFEGIGNETHERQQGSSCSKVITEERGRRGRKPEALWQLRNSIVAIRSPNRIF
jgi:hypothetical protein